MEQQFSPQTHDDVPLQPARAWGPAFTVGAALGQGFGTFFKNLPALLLIGLITFSPLFAYGLTRDTAAMSLQDLGATFTRIGFGSFLFGLLLNAAVTFGVVEHMNGRRARVGRSLWVGLRTMIPAILLMFVLAVIGGIFGFLVILMVSLIAAISPALGVIAMFAVVALFFRFFCMLYVAVPALAIERIGVTEAISRSVELTRGRLFQVFAVWLVTFLLGLGLSYAIGRVFGGGGFDPSSLRTAIVLNLGAQTLASLLTATITATVYVLLRNDKDGVGVAELAKVFD